MRLSWLLFVVLLLLMPLQYPYEQSEDGQYYSGYDDAVHEGESYTGYSIWVRRERSTP